MLPLSPLPRNRLYTHWKSYWLYLIYCLYGQFQDNRQAVNDFEQALCDRLETCHAICVYQCRVGLYLAVKALIQPGQAVILSPYTLADVVNMVIFAGGRPVFADVDRETGNISATEVERLITPNTGAVLITHLHGLAAAAHRIKTICDRHQVPLIEDCAQAFGVVEQGKPVGTIGDVGVFSFEMHKNLPTWLGGAIVSNRSDVIEAICSELNTFSYPPLPGLTQKVKKGLIHDLAATPVLFQLLTYPLLRFSYLNRVETVNQMARRQPQESQPATDLPEIYRSYYTPFQARLGLLQLSQVDRDIQIRINHATLYYEGLRSIEDLVLPPLRTDGSQTYLWFPVQYSHRDDLLRYLYQQGRDIAPGHFTNTADVPQFQAFYRDCPQARRVERELLYLPTYPSYSRREIECNIQVIQTYFKATARLAVASDPAIASVPGLNR